MKENTKNLVEELEYWKNRALELEKELNKINEIKIPKEYFKNVKRMIAVIDMYFDNEEGVKEVAEYLKSRGWDVKVSMLGASIDKNVIILTAFKRLKNERLF